MNTTNTQCLLETWQPEPKKPLVGEIPVKEGKTLPNSVTEDVMGMALMPQYSTRQLRKINRQQRKYSELLMMNTITTGGSIQW
jgi:hypothetical protein|tara:strand:+ start:200 stop:448 length:249 start_codon:yes stop_codon:yes gene_type:complete